MGFWQGELELHDAIKGLERLPKSKQFVSSQHKAAAYVGGEGASKTASLCLACILNSAADPNGLSLVGRLNMPALEATTMRTFLEMVPENYGTWAEAKKTWTFENGHQVLFRHLDISDPKVTGHIRSLNLSAAYVDEASEVNKEVFLMLMGRLRRKTAFRRIYRSASNPAGHDYQWEYFFDPDRPKEWKELAQGIGSTSMENVFLPADYHTSRKSLYPADWYDRFVNGSFTDFTDLIYKEFSDISHVWDDMRGQDVFNGQKLPPVDWPVLAGMDVGGGEEGDPWAIPLASLAPDGSLYQFAEIYGSDLRIAPIAEQFNSAIAGRALDGMAYDYAQRAAAIELEDYGIFGQPAVKDVKPGLFKTAQYMHIDPRLEHPFTKKQGAPRYFVAKSCVNTIRELGGYKWAKDKSGNPKNEPSHANSHCPDGVRYMIHTFRPMPSELVAPKKWENPKLDVASRLYWQRAAEQEEKTSNRRFGFSTLKNHEMRVKETRRVIPPQ